MFNNIIFLFKNLQLSQKCVPLHCVFHSIRFKVNKRLEQGVAPFFLSLPQFNIPLANHFYLFVVIITEIASVDKSCITHGMETNIARPSLN